MYIYMYIPTARCCFGGVSYGEETSNAGHTRWSYPIIFYTSIYIYMEADEMVIVLPVATNGPFYYR